ncbi:MAG: hypothetical protein VW619_09570, partial [Rhodobiaceae bacterium]
MFSLTGPHPPAEDLWPPADCRGRPQAKTEISLASQTTSAAEAATENFADLLAESFGEHTNIEGSVVRGFVV